MLRRRPHPNARTTRKRPAGQSPLVPLLVIGALVIGTAVAIFFGRAEQIQDQSPEGIVNAETEAILNTWKVGGGTHPRDKTGRLLFSPTTWTILETRTATTRAQVVVNVDSTNSGGEPIKSTWVFGWSNRSGPGWVATQIDKVGAAPSWEAWTQ